MIIKGFAILALICLIACAFTVPNVRVSDRTVWDWKMGAVLFAAIVIYARFIA